MTVPSGVPDSTPPPLAQFSLTPAATVDEGSNWINMFYGPLSLVNPTILSGGTGYGALIGNYALAAGSPAIDQIPRGTSHGAFEAAPHFDFFGNPRPDPSNLNAIDIGAVEFQGGGAQGTATFSAGSFNNVGEGTTSQLAIVATVATAPVSFDTATLTGSTAFTIVSNGCTGTTVAVGSTCTITVQYAPTTFTTNNGVLHIADNAVGSPQPVALTGTGVPGTASPSPSLVPFGSVQAGAAAVSQTVTVTNSGPGVLTFAADSVGGVDFTKGTDSCAGAAVLPGNSCTIGVNFTPTAAGAAASTARSGTLTIRNNGSSGNVLVALTGTVVQAVVAISAPVPPLNPTPATRVTKTTTITVSNTGAAALNLTGAPTVTKTGTGTGTFSIVAPASGTPCVSGGTVAAGGACTIGVQYVPPAAPAATLSTAHVAVTDTGAATLTRNSASFSGN
jgi:hypothetical protein